MVPPGPPSPFGGSQPVPTSSLLRSSSGMLGGPGGAMPSQGAFSSMVSPRNQFANMNMMGNMPNVSSLLQQSLANAGPSPGISGLGVAQRLLMDNGAESDPLSAVGNGMGYNAPGSSFVTSSIANASVTGQGQQFSNSSVNHTLADSQRNSQIDPQRLLNNQQQQQQLQSMRSGLGVVGTVKLEPQVANDQPPQQLHALHSTGIVKMEPQQIPSTRSIAPVKMEPQSSDSPMFLNQQQQQQQPQQQFFHVSRQSPQAAAAAQLLHQQRLLQIQQHHQQQQQQQLIKAIPQQRPPLQQQFQAQNLPMRSPAKPEYEPGMCARRLTHYMYQQQRRPEDNNLDFWNKFVAEYFAPNAKKKWCVSMYGSSRQTTGVFPQDAWHCEICNRKPGRGFEATIEVLPRLFKIKYESGTLEELLYVDMPREYMNSSGQIVLDYAKAIQESVFEQLRVVRDGQLRIVFSQDLKICSWEFCARRHEELIPRRLLIPQVNQLGAAAQKYQAATQNAPPSMSAPELQNNCNMFVASARQLAKALEVPLVNDLGYTKRYVRCLQISEVVNSMKDLIDFSKETGIGPMESLAKFPRRTSSSSGFNGQLQQTDNQQQQQTTDHNSNGDACVQSTSMRLSSINSMANINSTSNPAAPTSASAAAGHQNSMNSRQQNPVNGGSSPYGGTSAQLPSPSSSSTFPQTQPAPSPFQSSTPLSNNQPLQTSIGAVSAGMHVNSAASPNIALQQPAMSSNMDVNDSQGSVQKIIQEMMMTSQLGGGAGSMMGLNNLGNDLKNGNSISQTPNNTSLCGNNGLVGNGFPNSHTGLGGGGSEFGNLSNGLGQAAMVNGIRAALSNNSMTSSGRVGMMLARQHSMNQQHDLGSQPLNGLGPVNNFHNLQFDWKASP